MMLRVNFEMNNYVDFKYDYPMDHADIMFCRPYKAIPYLAN